MESITVSDIMPVSQERLFSAWLNAEEHAAFTGGGATCNPVVGGEFTAWDNYIKGINLELQPFNRILQSWRSTDFSDNDENSKLEILLEPAKDGTKITLKHYNIPDGWGQGYKEGWVEHYFTPMKSYFLAYPK